MVWQMQHNIVQTKEETVGLEEIKEERRENLKKKKQPYFGMKSYPKNEIKLHSWASSSEGFNENTNSVRK